MSQLITMSLSDLRQQVRDRSLIIFGVVVPVVLIAVFNLVFGDTDDLELRPVTIVTAVPEGDQSAAVLLDVLREIDLGDLEITLQRASSEQVRGLVRKGEADLGLVIPRGFAADVRGGAPAVVTVVHGENRELESQVVLSVIDGTLQQFEAAAEAGTAAAIAGVAPGDTAAVAQAAVTQRPEVSLVEGETSAEQLDTGGALVAGQAGLFLLFTVGFGVLSLLRERETGTLARLRSMPMRPGLIVGAKAAVGFVLGMVSTAIILGVGGWLFGTDFGPIPVVAVLVVGAAAAATSLMFVVVRVASTSEQAGVAQSIIALVLGIAGGAFFPIQASGVLGVLLDLNPVAALSRGLGITAGGGGLGDLGAPLAVMVGFTVLMVLLSRLLPDRGVVS